MDSSKTARRLTDRKQACSSNVPLHHADVDVPILVGAGTRDREPSGSMMTVKPKSGTRSTKLLPNTNYRFSAGMFSWLPRNFRKWSS